MQDDTLPDTEVNEPFNDSDVITSPQKKKPKIEPEDSISEEAVQKKSKSLVYEEDDPDALSGWKRLSVQRQGGVSAGKYDIYYISPLGKKLRSRKEVQTYCEKNSISVDFDSFRFSGRGPSGVLLESPLRRPSKKSAATPVTKSSPIKKTETPKTPRSPDGAKKQVKPKVPKNKTPSFKVSSDGLTRVKLKSSWIPPKSPYGLFQEDVFSQPWQILAGSIVLNKSCENEMEQEILTEFFKKWPTADSVIRAPSWSHVAESLNSVHNRERKAKMIVKFSEEFLTKKWTYPKELHGIGKYGNDSYRVFCINEWKKVRPIDYLLNFYVDWLWDNHTVLGID